MTDALHWLGSFFPRYGSLALSLALVLAIAGLLLRAIGGKTAASLAPTVLRVAGVVFVAFVLMAAFHAFRF